MSCGRKTAYRQEADAIEALLSLAVARDEHPARAARLNAYRCVVCGAWHVGHTYAARPTRRGKRRKRSEGV